MISQWWNYSWGCPKPSFCLVLPSWWLYYYFWGDHFPSRPLHVSLTHLPKREKMLLEFINCGLLGLLLTHVKYGLFWQIYSKKTPIPSTQIQVVDKNTHIIRNEWYIFSKFWAHSSSNWTYPRLLASTPKPLQNVPKCVQKPQMLPHFLYLKLETHHQMFVIR